MRLLSCMWRCIHKCACALPPRCESLRCLNPHPPPPSPPAHTDQTLWKAYIDFELEEGEEDRTRRIFERLLERTQHVKVRGAGQMKGWLVTCMISDVVDDRIACSA